MSEDTPAPLTDDDFEPVEGQEPIAPAAAQANFEDTLSEILEQTGKSLSVDITAVAAYAAVRSAFLSTLVGQPGFADAVLAERDNVLLKAGIKATRSSDQFDQRLVGAIQAALRTTAVLAAA